MSTKGVELEYEWVAGRDLEIGDAVNVWFGRAARVLHAADYTGPLAHLWPDGARIVTFTSSTPSGMSGMTVPNGDRFQRVVTRKPEGTKERKPALVSADGAFQCAPDLAVEVAYLMSTAEAQIVAKPGEATEIGQILVEYLDGTLTVEQAMKAIRE